MLVLAFDRDRFELCIVELSDIDPLMLDEYALLLDIIDPETVDRFTILVVRLLVVLDELSTDEAFIIDDVVLENRIELFSAFVLLTRADIIVLFRICAIGICDAFAYDPVSVELVRVELPSMELMMLELDAVLLWTVLFVITLLLIVEFVTVALFTVLFDTMLPFMVEFTITDPGLAIFLHSL